MNQNAPIEIQNAEPKKQKKEKIPLSERSWIYKFFRAIAIIIFQAPFMFVWFLIQEIFARIYPFILFICYIKYAAPWLSKHYGHLISPWLKWILWWCLPMCIVITGCSSIQQKPATIGTGTDDLKKSLCVRCTQKPFYKNGQWLIKRRDS